MIQIQSCTTGNFFDLQPDQEVSLTIDNPLFADDSLPIAVSTAFEFPLSEINRKEFGFVDFLMLQPANKKIPATLFVAGIQLLCGEICFDEYSDGTLKYTFSGANTADIFSGAIYEIECENYNGMLINDFTSNARKNIYPDIGLPMIVYKSNSAKIEYNTENAAPQCSTINKYANYLYSETPYIIPALKIPYLLQKIHTGLVFPVEAKKIIDKLAILGVFKPKTWQSERYGIPHTVDRGPIIYLDKFNFAESLPNVSAIDFITNLLKMFCCSLFSDGAKYSIRCNKDILNDNSNIDWTTKIADVYSLTTEGDGRYSFEYANSDEEKDMQKKDTTPENSTSEEMAVVSTYEELITKINVSENYINVKVDSTGSIYSGKNIRARLYFYRDGTFADTETILPDIGIIHQHSMANTSTSVESNDKREYDSSVNFICPRCIPSSVATSIPTVIQPPKPQVTLRGVSPVVEISPVSENRSSDIYIGLLENHNFFDQGNYYSPITPYADKGDEIISDMSIAIGGVNGLYEKFHKPFAEWFIEDASSIKASVVLSPTDVANLRLWQKILIQNRTFLIKTMGITMSNKCNMLIANVEFREV